MIYKLNIIRLPASAEYFDDDCHELPSSLPTTPITAISSVISILNSTCGILAPISKKPNCLLKVILRHEKNHESMPAIIFVILTELGKVQDALAKLGIVVKSGLPVFITTKSRFPEIPAISMPLCSTFILYYQGSCSQGSSCLLIIIGTPS